MLEIKNTKFFLSSYFAAGIVFLLSVFRDFCLSISSVDAEFFFLVIYFTAIPSSFLVNYVATSPVINFGRSLWLLSFFCAAAITLAFWFYQDAQADAVFVGLLAFFWVLGAVGSKELLHSGDILFSRSREGVAALVIGLLAIFYPISPAGLALVGAICAWIFVRLIILIRVRSVSVYRDNENRSFDSVALFLVNICPVLVNCWGIWFISASSSWFGVDAVWLSRIGLYLFQGLTISSILIPSGQLVAKSWFYSGGKYVFVAGFLIFILSIVYPFMSFIFVPLYLVIANFFLIFYVNKRVC